MEHIRMASPKGPGSRRGVLDYRHPMFRAVNTESESDRRRACLERQKIQNVYLSTLKTMKLSKLLSMEVRYEQNYNLLCNAKSNLLYGFVRRMSMGQLLESMECGFLESKVSFFEFVRKCIAEGNFIRAHKLLNLAKSREWVGNDYFELREEIGKKYASGIKPRRLLQEVLQKRPRLPHVSGSKNLH